MWQTLHTVSFSWRLKIYISLETVLGNPGNLFHLCLKIGVSQTFLAKKLLFLMGRVTISIHKVLLIMDIYHLWTSKVQSFSLFGMGDPKGDRKVGSSSPAQKLNSSQEACYQGTRGWGGECIRSPSAMLWLWKAPLRSPALGAWLTAPAAAFLIHPWGHTTLALLLPASDWGQQEY